MGSHRLLIFLSVSVFFLAAQPRIGLAYKERTHEVLTGQALEVVRGRGENRCARETWQVYSDAIRLGSHDEDLPCNKEGLRANNHYRHAISGIGLIDAPYVGMKDPDVDTLSWAKTNPHLNPAEEFQGGKHWLGFSRWGFTDKDVDSGNMSWEKAITRYDYSARSKTLAYYTLGFVVHLLQDMGCPEHVHEDPHGASSFSGFEGWVDEKWQEIKPDTGQLQPYQSTGPIDKFFTNLSDLGYSAVRFRGFSSAQTLEADPSLWVDRDSDLAQMFHLTYRSAIAAGVRGWELRNHRRNPARPAGPSSAPSPDGQKPGDEAPMPILEGSPNSFLFFGPVTYRVNALSHKGKGDGDFWPTCLEITPDRHKLREVDKARVREDEPGFFYIELSGDLPDVFGPVYHGGVRYNPGDSIVSAARALYPRHYLPTPLKSVEAQTHRHGGWYKRDTEGQHLYRLVGRALMPHIVEHSAGLIQRYFEIVNHPPMVVWVSMEQDGDPPVRYLAGWEDVSEPWPGKDTVPRIVRRQWKAQHDGQFRPGTAKLAIRFSEAVESDVTVTFGDVKVRGALEKEDGDFWLGEVAIPRGSPGKEEVRVRIAARDRDRHAENLGADLDSDPSSPARRTCVSETIAWQGYEPGEDSRHRILLKRPDEAPRGEKTPPGDSSGKAAVLKYRVTFKPRQRPYLSQIYSFPDEPAGKDTQVGYYTTDFSVEVTNVGNDEAVLLGMKIWSSDTLYAKWGHNEVKLRDSIKPGETRTIHSSVTVEYGRRLVSSSGLRRPEFPQQKPAISTHMDLECEHFTRNRPFEMEIPLKD